MAISKREFLAVGLALAANRRDDERYAGLRILR